MSRGQQRRVRVKTSRRAVRKAQRRRARRAGRGTVAAASAVALGLAGMPAGHTAAYAAGELAELVVDARPGALSGRPSYLTPVGGEVFFSVDDGVHGAELWRTDGTAAGTALVKDINAGANDGSEPSLLTSVGSTLFFAADDGSGRALWKSDGTAAGTVEVAPVEPQGAAYGFPVVGDTVFFAAEDEHGRELWASDGTTEGTLLVKDINPGVDDDDYYGVPYPRSSQPSEFAAVGGTLFFRADDGVHGEELWSSDGTEAGTVLVKDIVVNDDYYYGPDQFTAVGGTLFFRATDGTSGRELWKSDGTAAGTVMVKDIFPGTYGTGYPREGSPQGLVGANGTLFFGARDAHGFELWKSDGTSGGTVLVKDVRPGVESSLVEELTPVGETVFFAATDGAHGYELWKTDGTSGGTVLVKDLYPGTYSYYGEVYANDGSPAGLTASAGTLFFTASDGRGRETWSSDGTAAGTGLVRDIRPGPEDSSPRYLTASPAGGVLFGAFDETHGRELWRAAAFQPLPTPPPVIASNQFTLPKRGKADPKKGTLTLTVALPGPGTLVLGPSGSAPVKVTSRSVAGGDATVTIRLTKTGMKRLRKKLEHALEDGKKVGKLRVAIEVTFTPQGGTARTLARTYTAKLKARSSARSTAGSADERPG